MKIATATRLAWTIVSVLLDFVGAAALMLLLGSLGVHWGYWHAWWVTFTGTFVSGVILFPVVVRMEYLIEGGRE